MMSIPDHPVIRNMERTGYPDGKEPTYPRCPMCGKKCGFIFLAEGIEIVGCDICMTTKSAWDVNECFPEGDEHI